MSVKKVSQLISSFRASEIPHIFNQAKQIYKSKELTILAAPCSLSFGRVLIIASRKYGNSPQRNLIKRRIRAIFYENQLYNNHKDFIIITRSALQKLSFQALQNLLCKHLV